MEGGSSSKVPRDFGAPGVYHPSVIIPPNAMCTCVGAGDDAFGAGPAPGVRGGSGKNDGQSPPLPCGTPVMSYRSVSVADVSILF